MAVIEAAERKHAPARRNYATHPMIIYWEMTQACGLACRHCRADAMTEPHPLELSFAESKSLLRQIKDFGDPLPHLILTGGDPLRRSGLFELIAYANQIGLKTSITPAATAVLTSEALAALKENGIQSLGLSLDGSTARKHDAVRGVPGCYDTTLRAARMAAELSMPVQVNTLVSEETADDLPAIFELLNSLQVMRWSLFFLIAVGRGRILRPVTPARGEAIMNWVYDVRHAARFAIKTTEAPSYRRIALERMRSDGMSAAEIRATSVYQGFGIRDGHGIMFVSSTGDIYPSGFLPLKLGNVRKDSLAAAYRGAPMFRSLHDSSEFTGKCGICEYRRICGGSRARAFAETGDALASDPFCPYQPTAGMVEA